MKLLIILPAKIQAEMPFQQRCKEQVVKYSPKMFWKVHANWFVAKVFSLKTSRTLVLQTCINGKETGISATTTEEQHYYRLQAKSLADSSSVDSSINMRQSWMKSVENFALSYPQNAYPVDLVPLWRLPSHHPGQCCSDGVRKYTATFFWRERVVFAVASAFRSFIFKLDIATCIFLNVFFFQNLSTEQGLLPERQCGFGASGYSRYDICGWSWINQYQHQNLSTTLVDLTKAFDTFSRDDLRKIMSKSGCPPLSSPLLGRSF